MYGTKSKRNRMGYLFMAPFLIMFLFFFVIPLIMGIVMSFTEYGLQDTSATWVGLDNYKTILFDSESVVHQNFVNGMIHSTMFVIIFVPIIYCLSLLMALMVYHLPKKVQGFYRTIYFIPFAISVSAMAAIWKFAFNTQSGVINQILAHFGVEAVPWLTQEPTAWLVVVLATLWWTIGFNMIIFLNALNNVNEEMYEAASIDGATGIKKFFKITLPSIKSATIFVIITQTIASYNLYGQVKLITNGGPNESTKTVLMAIIEEGFNNRNMGMAAAMAILLALVIIGISLVQYIISRRFDEKNKFGMYLLVFIASLVALTFILPILWMVLTSFKTDIEAMVNQTILPQNWTIDNYVYAIEQKTTMPIGRWFFNSLFVASASTFLVIIFDVLAAYAFARIDFKGSGLIMSLLVMTLMIPGIVTLIPAFKLYANMGLINTYIPLIIPYTINVFGIFLLYTFIKDYPRELEEAAVIDGASQLTILRKVVFPAIKPVVATLGIITFMGCYNDYLWPLLVTNSADMRTITTGIAIVNQGAFSTQYGKVMAMTVIATIPVIIVFIVGQKHIVKGITNTGIK